MAFGVRRRRRGSVFGLVSLLVLAAAALGPTRAEGPEQATGAEAPWLGVVLGDAVDGGVRLLAVIPGGPASRAGLAPGDVLLRLDREPVPEPMAVRRVLLGKRIGEPMQVLLLRDGSPLRRELRLAARPESFALSVLRGLRAEPGAPELASRLGLRLEAIPSELRLHFGAPEDAGLLVARVREGGAGAEAGVRVGDVLVGVCGVPLREPSASDPCGERADAALLELVREGARKRLKVALGSDYAAGRPDADRPGVPDSDPREERIRREIERLERRLRELRHELGELDREQER